MTKSETREFYNSMDAMSYTTAMGGTATDNITGASTQNISADANVRTGLNPTNAQIWKYFGELREYAMNRYMWSSSILSEYELRLIEWHIFHSGVAFLVRPRFNKTGSQSFELTQPRVFLANVTRRNLRTFEPLTISLATNSTDTSELVFGLSLQQTYDVGQFEMITNNFNASLTNLSDAYYAWEYANKLHELDLLFNANITKGRLPLLFSNGAKQDKNNMKLFNRIGVGISDIVRKALTANDQFVEIPEDKVGEKGLLHQTNQYTDFKGAELVQLQQVIINQYLEKIGISNPKEQHGVYINENVQTLSTESTIYKTYCGLKNRQICMNKVNKHYGLDLTVEAWNSSVVMPLRNFDINGTTPNEGNGVA